MTRRADHRRASIGAAVLVGVLGLAGCSSDSDEATTTNRIAGDDPRTELVDLTMQGLAEQGIAADRACIVGLADQLTVDDTRKLVQAYPDGDPKVSGEARGIGAELLTCADRNDLLDTLVTSVLATAPVSEACIRHVLDPLDVTQLAALLQPSDEQDDAGAAVLEQLLACRPATG